MEPDIEAQRAAIASWNEAHEFAQQETASRSESGRTTPPVTQGKLVGQTPLRGDAGNPSQEGHVKVISPRERKNQNQNPRGSHKEKERFSRKTPDPVRAMVDKTLAQDKTCHKRHRTPRAMEPVEQVDPKSYIGLALERLGKDKRTHHRKDDSSDGSSSNSSSMSRRRRSKKRRGRRTHSIESSDRSVSSSESSESYTETDSQSPESGESSSGSSSSHSEGHRGRRRKHSRPRGQGSRKTKKSRSKKRKSRRRMKLKPIPPVEYDGSVDSKAFHRFITEGTAYVKDREVPSKKQAFILSHYLKGRAHEFYVQEVSGDPYRWRLSTFFRELFNYCFPVDFRIKL